MQLLLDVWREACRHIEIGGFVARIAPRLRERIPFRLLLVRRVELDRGRIETLATSADAGSPQPHARTECSPQEIDEVLRWCKTGAPLGGRSGRGPGGPRLLAQRDLTSASRGG